MLFTVLGGAFVLIALGLVWVIARAERARRHPRDFGLGLRPPPRGRKPRVDLPVRSVPARRALPANRAPAHTTQRPSEPALVESLSSAATSLREAVTGREDHPSPTDVPVRPAAREPRSAEQSPASPGILDGLRGAAASLGGAVRGRRATPVSATAGTSGEADRPAGPSAFSQFLQRARVLAAAAATATGAALVSFGKASAESWRGISARVRQATSSGEERADLPPLNWTPILVFVGAIALLIAAFIMLGGSGEGTGETPSGIQPTQSSGTEAPGAGVLPTNETTATATQALPATTGDPFSESSFINALRAASLEAAVVDEPLACQNPGVTPRTYRVSSRGRTQEVSLFVYPSPAEMNADWAIEGGSPLQFRNGACATGASIIYWNQNLTLVLMETTDQGLRQQIRDAFLAVAP